MTQYGATICLPILGHFTIEIEFTSALEKTKVLEALAYIPAM